MKNWKLLALSLMLTTNTVFAEPQVIDGVVAVVNNGAILESDVASMVQLIKGQSKQNRQQLPDDSTLRHQILERLIMDEIVLQTGKKMDIHIGDQQLNNVIKDIAAQNKISQDEMRTRLAFDGIDYTDYREQIRRDVLISEVRNREIGGRVTILPQEVDALAEKIEKQNSPSTEFNLSHILLALPENPTQKQANEQEQLARKLIAELNGGSDFGKLATTYSTGPQALKGGNMGWERIQALPTLFTQALSTAKKGDVVGPIYTGVGLHILKVNDIRSEREQISVTEFHARHILLKPSVVLTEEQAKQQLKQIANDIKAGKITFEMAAKQFSEDPGSKNKGGDLGWVSPEIFDPSFRNALLKLEKNHVSEPVRSSFGWHLIELLDTRDVDKTDVAAKERAYRLLFNRKFAEEAQIWMQEQRARAYVKILETP